MVVDKLEKYRLVTGINLLDPRAQVGATRQTTRVAAAVLTEAFSSAAAATEMAALAGAVVTRDAGGDGSLVIAPDADVAPAHPERRTPGSREETIPTMVPAGTVRG